MGLQSKHMQRRSPAAGEKPVCGSALQLLADLLLSGFAALPFGSPLAIAEANAVSCQCLQTPPMSLTHQ